MKQAELNAMIRTALRHARIGVAPGGPVEIDIQGENVRLLWCFDLARETGVQATWRSGDAADCKSGHA